MKMYNPPHPGEFIEATYLEPFAISRRLLARHLQVAPSTLNRLINGDNAVSPEMACRLSVVLGRTPESWLSMQAQYDLHHTVKPKCQRIDFDSIEKAA